MKTARIIELHMGRRTKKPTDPAEIARLKREARAEMEAKQRTIARNPELWGVDEAALSLAANTDVEDKSGARGKVRQITRYDCFAILRARGSIETAHLGAVRRLEGVIAERLGADGRDLASVAVDNSRGEAASYPLRRIEAYHDLVEIAQRTGALSFRVLLALCEPAVVSGQPVNNWRSVVKRVTGEPHDKGQTSQVKMAVQNLLEAFQAIDHEARPARKAVRA